MCVSNLTPWLKKNIFKEMCLECYHLNDQVGRRRRRWRSGHLDPDSGSGGRRVDVDVDSVFRSVGFEDDPPRAERGESKRNWRRPRARSMKDKICRMAFISKAGICDARFA